MCSTAVTAACCRKGAQTHSAASNDNCPPARTGKRARSTRQLGRTRCPESSTACHGYRILPQQKQLQSSAGQSDDAGRIAPHHNNQRPGSRPAIALRKLAAGSTQWRRWSNTNGGADNQTEASNAPLPHIPVDPNTSNTSVNPTPALPGSWHCSRTQPASRQLHHLPNATVCTRVGAQGVSTQWPQRRSK
jgi:hypothetical protein